MRNWGYRSDHHDNIGCVSWSWNISINTIVRRLFMDKIKRLNGPKQTVTATATDFKLHNKWKDNNKVVEMKARLPLCFKFLSGTFCPIHCTHLTAKAAAMPPMSRETSSTDEVLMQQSLLFSESLKGLKNLRTQLYSAAEYFEVSYTNDDQKQMVVETLKDYAIKALVNTVDHLGSMTYKVNDLLDENLEQVSGTELRVSCIEQRLQTCRDLIDREGLSQQSLVINMPKYHKRYILPGKLPFFVTPGETINGANRTKLKFVGCGLDDEDDWHQLRNDSNVTSYLYWFLLSCPRYNSRNPDIFSLQNPDVVPERAFSITFSAASAAIRNLFLYGHHASYELIDDVKMHDQRSKQYHRIDFRFHGLNPSAGLQPQIRASRLLRIQPYPSEPRKSASMRLQSEKGSPKDIDQYPNKSKRLLKALLSRPKSKKDEMLYTYLNEY
ncbi:protein ABIL2-like [Gossypium australe]|uniref:Protein ABIL2-like n=1 Tax=Gossypium australe TaxID=47621 RepID=A0A5B6UDF1_9ROSI|nr:protein ABIL2-like [Gossypium australe]